MDTASSGPVVEPRPEQAADQPPPLPGGGRTQGTPRQRVDATAWLGMLLSLPWIVTSVSLVLLLGSVLGERVWAPLVWLVPVLWGVSGAFVLLPGIEPLLTRVARNARPPSEGERRRLEPVWSRVLDDVAVDPRRFRLWVQDSADLNAAAAGGRIVIVTKGALRLPPDTLAAILAHELGHHLGGHPLLLLLQNWYSIPTRLLVRLTMLLVWAIATAGGSVARSGNGIGILLGLLVLAAAVVLTVRFAPLLLLVPVASVLLAAVGRLSEIRADRMAARLGYGPALIEVHRQWIREGHDLQRQAAGLRARVFATHPSSGRRVEALERFLGRSSTRS